MAIFRISSTGAVGTLLSANTLNLSAFSSGTALADTLTIDADAFLLTQWTTSGTATVFLNALAPWTVNVNGYVAAYGTVPNKAFDIRADSSKVSIGATGSVSSNGTAFDVAGANFSLTNRGTVTGLIALSGTGINYVYNYGDMNGVSLTGGIGSDRLTNTAIFGGSIDLTDGADRVTNSGIINGSVNLGLGDDIVTNSGRIEKNLVMGDGSNTLSNSGYLGGINLISLASLRSYEGGSGIDKVTNSGVILTGLRLGEGANSVNNQVGGFIQTNVSIGMAAIIGGASTDTVTNAGEIRNKIDLGNGTNTLNNSGLVNTRSSAPDADTLYFASYEGGSGSDRITNSGTIYNTIKLGEGVNTVNNQLGGRIIAGTTDDFASESQPVIIGGASTDTVTNAGNIIGAINLGNGTNTLNNSGFMSLAAGPNFSIYAYEGGSGADRITNSGTISTSIQLGDGNNSLTNSGTIESAVYGGSGIDIIINSGSIGSDSGSSITATLSLGGGNNVVTNTGFIDQLTTFDGVDTFTLAAGSITKRVDSGAGNDGVTIEGRVDNLTVGAGADTVNAVNGTVIFVSDDAGNDSYTFGGDATIFLGSGLSAALDASDFVDAGAGIDSYLFRSNSLAGTINLSATTKIVGSATISANSATSDGAIDNIFNFENAYGSVFGDIIVGSAVANVLSGLDGGDSLFGDAGNDTLLGENGLDLINGGLGRDTLTGGQGQDLFIYTSRTESGVASTTRDTITDFDFLGYDNGGDVIDLTPIDANSLLAGNQAFTFIGTNVNWNNTAGALRARWTATGQIVESDVNGDNVADFSIFIRDGGNHQMLSSSDFDDFFL
jgi:Ca2+-binding RTX toxin-like protein